MSSWVPSDRQCHSRLSTRGGIFIFVLITLRGGRRSMAFSQNQTKPNLSWNFHFLFDHIQTSQEDNWLVDQWFWDFSDITLVYENYWMFSLLKCLTPEIDLDASFFFYKNIHLNWSSLAPFPILCLNNLMSKRCPPRPRQTFHHILYFKLSYFLCFSYFLYFSHIS